MIEKTQSYKTSNGKIFGSIAEAQKEEVAILLNLSLNVLEPVAADAVLDNIIAEADKLVDVLTTKGSSKVRARSINGGKKTRTPKVSLPTLPATA